MKYDCLSCHQVFTNFLIPLDNMIDLHCRLQPGAMVPDGQCPSCRGFVYEKSRFATAREIDCARAMYQCSEVQIDNDAKASHADEHVCVQAWVYVPK